MNKTVKRTSSRSIYEDHTVGLKTEKDKERGLWEKDKKIKAAARLLIWLKERIMMLRIELKLEEGGEGLVCFDPLCIQIDRPGG